MIRIFVNREKRQERVIDCLRLLEYTNHCKTCETKGIPASTEKEAFPARPCKGRSGMEEKMGQEASGPKQAGGEKKTGKNRRKMEALSYRRTDMQKEMVIRKLRERRPARWSWTTEPFFPFPAPSGTRWFFPA